LRTILPSTEDDENGIKSETGVEDFVSFLSFLDFFFTIALIPLSYYHSKIPWSILHKDAHVVQALFSHCCRKCEIFNKGDYLNLNTGSEQDAQ
jgi:hypothetical protein